MTYPSLSIVFITVQRTSPDSIIIIISVFLYIPFMMLIRCLVMASQSIIFHSLFHHLVLSKDLMCVTKTIDVWKLNSLLFSVNSFSIYISILSEHVHFWKPDCCLNKVVSLIGFWSNIYNLSFFTESRYLANESGCSQDFVW